MILRRRASLASIALSVLACLVLGGTAVAHDPDKLSWAREQLGPRRADHELAGRQISTAASFVPELRSNFAVVSQLAIAPALNSDVAFYDHGGSVGKHVYVGSWGEPCTGRVAVVDVNDSANPVRVGGIGRADGISREDIVVARIGGRDILAAGAQPCGEGGYGGLELFDVTDPDNPSRLSFLDMPAGGVHELDIVVRPDGRALALLAVPFAELGAIFGDPQGGDFRIVDISDPENPVEVSNWGLVADSDMRLIAGRGAVTSPFQGLGYFAAYFAHSARAANNGMVAYVSYWDGGVIKFDISDPANPQVLGHTLFRRTDDGDAHSMTPFNLGGRRYILQNDEDAAGLSPGLLIDSSPVGPYGRRSHPFIEVPFMPTLLSDVGEITDRVVDAGDGCQRSDFAGAAGNFVLLDTPDPFYEMPAEGCTQFRQLLRAARAGARAAIVNLVSPDDAYTFGPISEDDERALNKLYEEGHTMTAVMISDIDGVADRIRSRLEQGTQAPISLRPRLPSYGFLRIFGEANPHDADNDGIRDYRQVGQFTSVRNVQGDLRAGPAGQWTIHNTEVLGDRAYISWYRNGIVALDMSDPSQPRFVGQYAPAYDRNEYGWGIWGVAIDPETNLIYASDMEHGLRILRPTGAARAGG